MSTADFIRPQWPAPGNVRALSTTRRHPHGHSGGEFAQFNLGRRSGEALSIVTDNEQELCRDLPNSPLWLQQVHGNRVINAAEHSDDIQADACFATTSGQVCAVLTADCLPVLLCDRQGSCVAAVHAGWRGLHAAIIAEAVNRIPATPDALLAWLGPAISQRHYEVGDDFRQRFVDQNSGYTEAFVRTGGRWRADLQALARRQLNMAGVMHIWSTQDCTFADEQRFYSYRRDGRTGRQASLIWMI